MSALSVPNLLSSQPKPSPQANNTQPESETPFASVLQQKVQTSKDDKPANTAEQTKAPAEPANAAQNQSEHTVEADGADKEATTAAALVNGDYAQNALQQLLPWLQSLQGKAAQAAAPDATATATDTALLPQAVANATQAQGALPTLQAQTKTDPKLSQSKDVAANTQAEPPTTQVKDGAAASTAANLAATSDTLTAGDKHKPFQESFDTALQGANQRIESQMPQTPAAHGATESRGQDANRLQSVLGTPQWQHEFSDRVQLMSRNNEGRAELVLTPPHLGRIEVTLNISGDQASAMFTSANPEVRTALEGAMDRLREALANNGISLGQAQVGSESSGQSADNRNGGTRQGGQIAGNGQEISANTVAWTRHSNNMLDVFA